MVPRIDKLLQRLDRPVICLEYKPEEPSASRSAPLTPKALEIRSTGMFFCSCWRFEPSMEISVSWEERGLVYTAVGVVVSCEKKATRQFRTTLFFLDKNQPAGREAQRV